MRPPVLGHLVVGPQQHGVVLHGLAVADATAGDVVVAVERPADLDLGDPGHADPLAALGACAAVCIPFTDRLLGDTCEDAAIAFVRVARRLRRFGVQVVVGLHDVPSTGLHALAARRRAAYRAVIQEADGAIVSSEHEAATAERLGAERRWLSVIPLPIPAMRSVTPTDAPAAEPSDGQPTVLGFIYPGKGHAEVIDALDGLPAQVGLVAVGRASDGHRSLVTELVDAAEAKGRSLRVTGFVPEAELPRALAAAGVPIAPHAAVCASGSIAAWLGAGRRPIVADGPYVRELDRRSPGSLWIYRGPEELRSAIVAALRDPGLTWLPGTVSPGPSTAEVMQRHRTFLRSFSPAPLPGRRRTDVPPTVARTGG